MVHNARVNAHLSEALLKRMGGAMAGERLCSTTVHVVIEVVFSASVSHLHVCSEASKKSRIPMSNSMAVEMLPLFSVDVVSDVIVVVSSIDDGITAHSFESIDSRHLRRSSIHLHPTEKVTGGCELRT